MDLGDFTPEEYLVSFTVSGRPYEVRYQEARVDEVLSLLAEAEKQTEGMTKELAEARRRYITELFSRNLASGDKDQLAEDLKTVPYISLRNGLDIYALYTMAQNRVKKKVSNGPSQAQTPVRRGLLARLLSW